jgi:hypothetical protein
MAGPSDCPHREPAPILLQELRVRYRRRLKECIADPLKLDVKEVQARLELELRYLSLAPASERESVEAQVRAEIQETGEYLKMMELLEALAAPASAGGDSPSDALRARFRKSLSSILPGNR